MPKFLFGRVIFYVTQVEAPTEEEARGLLNRNNAAKNECPALDNISGVGETHKYQKAWVEPEGTMMDARPMVLRELADTLNLIDHDGSRRSVVLFGPNGSKINPCDRPLGK